MKVRSRAADLFMAFLSYMAEFAKDPDAFSKSGLLQAPAGTMDAIAAEEWARVAPRLYEMDRLSPREILGLHVYCAIFSSWRQLSQKAETLTELQPYVEKEFVMLKQRARGFGFFLDDSGRMNLAQPLPLEPKKNRRRRSNGK